MKRDLASRRARIARVEAKRPKVEVVLHAKASNDQRLLADFDRWLQRVINPEQGVKP